jgi:predicted membrane-bound spermidine synthase
LRVPAVGVAFFLSGAAALVYQVVWQRVLELSSGIGIYSVAMIVAAFMAGLGIGSYAGSVLSLRLRPGRALRAFAALELGVAAFGALSCTLFYDILYLRASWLYAVAWRAGLLHFACLLFPTLLMGMSLPFLVRGLVRDAAGAAKTIGSLYSVNVLGASCGALLTPWVLIRFTGMRGAVLVAAGANAAACVAALLAAGAGPRTRKADGSPGAGQDAPIAVRAGAAEPPASRPLALWMVLYATSGFCALALEILWFRYLDVALRSTAFTFGTLLALYLLGCAVGSLASSARAERVERPLRAFLVLQSLLLACSALSIVLLSRLPPDAPVVSYFQEAWSSARFVRLGRETDVSKLAAMYLGLPAILFAVPTLLMGASFPVLQRAVQDDPATSGRKVGLLQAANIGGCIAGSLVVGLLSLQWLGTAGTFRALTALALVFPGIGAWFYGARSPFPALAAALLAVFVALPSGESLWARLHGASAASALIAEDATGLAALTPRADGWRVWINGRSFSTIPFGGLHTTLGAIPAIVHASPRSVAIVGLGSGDTASAVGCRGAVTERITVFEICGPNLELLRRVRDAGKAPPDLVRFLADPRVRHAVADGRNSLQNAPDRYDVIEIDALWPANAYSGNLYSVDFFTLCRRRLAQGGVMCSWCPTERVRASFRQAFPYVVQVFDGQVMVGSNAPIRIDRPAWEARLTSPGVVAYLGVESSRSVLEGLRSAALPEGSAAALVLNRDLYPRDEFRSP